MVICRLLINTKHKNTDIDLKIEHWISKRFLILSDLNYWRKQSVDLIKSYNNSFGIETKDLRLGDINRSVYLTNFYLDQYFKFFDYQEVKWICIFITITLEYQIQCVNRSDIGTYPSELRWMLSSRQGVGCTQAP